MTPGTIWRMTPEVEVDPDLAVRAAEVAAARGERVEDVIERALRAYIISRESNSGTSGDIG